MRYAKGDRVKVLLRGGGRDLPPVDATVLAESATGAEVEFVGGRRMWVTSDRIRVVGPDGSLVKAAHRKRGDRASDAPGRVTGVILDESHGAGAAEVRRSPTESLTTAVEAMTPQGLLAHISASGVDPAALWASLGRALAETARERVADARASYEAAARDLEAAEGLLREADAAVQAAQAAYGAAEHDRDEAAAAYGRARLALEAAERDAARHG